MPMPSKKSAAKTNPPKTLENQAVEISEIEPTETTVEYVKALVMLKGQNSVTVDVPEWEIQVLAEIHGDDGVMELSRYEKGYPYSAAQAMQYLRNKYRTREQADVVKIIWPSLKRFAQQFGLPYQKGDETAFRSEASIAIYHDQGLEAQATKQGAAGSGASGRAAV